MNTGHSSTAIIDYGKFANWLKINGYVALATIIVTKDVDNDIGSDDVFAGTLTNCQVLKFDGSSITGERWSILTELGPIDKVVRQAFKVSDTDSRSTGKIKKAASKNKTTGNKKKATFKKKITEKKKKAASKKTSRDCVNP